MKSICRLIANIIACSYHDESQIETFYFELAAKLFIQGNLESYLEIMVESNSMDEKSCLVELLWFLVDFESKHAYSCIHHHNMVNNKFMLTLEFIDVYLHFFISSFGSICSTSCN